MVEMSPAPVAKERALILDIKIAACQLLYSGSGVHCTVGHLPDTVHSARQLVAL